jgi:hypothetical protein
VDGARRDLLGRVLCGLGVLASLCYLLLRLAGERKHLGTFVVVALVLGSSGLLLRATVKRPKDT